MSALLCRLAMLAVALPLATGCAFVQEHSGTAAGVVGVAVTADEMTLFKPEYVAGALIAYAIYDPIAPTWNIRVQRVDEERVRFELRMKALHTGGEGEARQVFLRNARQLAEAEGLAGFDVIRYEEGVESTRPFARRVASGEIRLARSRVWPAL